MDDVDPVSAYDSTVIAATADDIAAGGVVGFFFNGAYALLGDADRTEAADTIFRLKRRPREQTLSLVADPRHWHEFIDLGATALSQFPLDRVVGLHEQLHALGVIYPADPISAPKHLVQDATILNVWTRYGPLIALHEACRERGRRALMGASANLSGEPTYTTAARMAEVFGSELAMIFAEDEAVPLERRQSVSLIDLTGAEPTLVRKGNTTTTEVAEAVAGAGLGRLRSLG